MTLHRNNYELTNVAKQVHVQINSQKQLIVSSFLHGLIFHSNIIVHILPDSSIKIYIYIKKNKKLMCHIAHRRKHNNVDEEKKNPIIYFMRIEWPFILKT